MNLGEKGVPMTTAASLFSDAGLMTTTSLSAALDYAARGWRVLPVEGKIPVLKEWPTLATTDYQTIRTWWTQWPTANVGIATGKRSGLLILDVDIAKGGDETLRKLEAQYGELPRSIEVITGGGGRHYYFEHPDCETRNSAGKLGPGLDIRTDGGQVVAPPSIHPKTGHSYEWEVAHHPDDVPLAPVPGWLLDMLTAKTEHTTFPKSGEMIPEGQRNDALARVAGKLRHIGMSEKVIEAALQKMNQENCTPPLSDDEVHDIAASVARYPAPVEPTSFPSVIPLDDVALPDFPVDAFPAPLGDMMDAVAKATETPVELAATMGLATVAACCQNVFEVLADAGYSEPLCLWTVAALESGNRKTAVHRKMTEPLRKKERELCEQSKAKIAQAESERATIKERVKALRPRLANSADYADSAMAQDEITRLESSMPDIPMPPRLWAQDITPEKLGALMADNGERLALLSDEGGLFDILGGRYSNNIPNLDTFLQSHAGAPVRVDRGSRPPVVMHHPTLTIGLSPQPGVLRELTTKPGFRDRGLLARFLYALPTSRLGYRSLKAEPVADAVVTKYAAMIEALLRFESASNEYGDSVPFAIQLSTDARREWQEFAERVECNMRPQGTYEYVKDWAGKLPGAALRVAGNFHCVMHAQGQPWAVDLALETMTCAVTVLTVLSQHALAVFDLMGADPALDSARKVWGWIERGRLPKITARQCFNDLRGSFPKMADLDPAFVVLCERGYLLTAQDHRPGPGRPSRRYIANPKLTKGWV